MGTGWIALMSLECLHSEVMGDPMQDWGVPYIELNAAYKVRCEMVMGSMNDWMWGGVGGGGKILEVRKGRIQ